MPFDAGALCWVYSREWHPSRSSLVTRPWRLSFVLGYLEPPPPIHTQERLDYMRFLAEYNPSFNAARPTPYSASHLVQTMSA